MAYWKDILSVGDGIPYLTIPKFRSGFIFARLIFAHLIFAHPEKNVFHAVLIFAHFIEKYNFAHF